MTNRKKAQALLRKAMQGRPVRLSDLKELREAVAKGRLPPMKKPEDQS